MTDSFTSISSSSLRNALPVHMVLENTDVDPMNEKTEPHSNTITFDMSQHRDVDRSKLSAQHGTQVTLPSSYPVSAKQIGLRWILRMLSSSSS